MPRNLGMGNTLLTAVPFLLSLCSPSLSGVRTISSLATTTSSMPAVPVSLLSLEWISPLLLALFGLLVMWVNTSHAYILKLTPFNRCSCASITLYMILVRTPWALPSQSRIRAVLEKKDDWSWIAYRWFLDPIADISLELSNR